MQDSPMVIPFTIQALIRRLNALKDLGQLGSSEAQRLIDQVVEAGWGHLIPFCVPKHGVNMLGKQVPADDRPDWPAVGWYAGD